MARNQPHDASKIHSPTLINPGHDAIDRSELRIRDPYIVEYDDRYLLFGTTDPSPWNGPGVGFDRYESGDLEQWTGPFPAFRPSPGFWGETQFWAPEVHSYNGAWWMFATFADHAGRRGTQVLAATGPDGLFQPWSDGPVTPSEWMCLDGTLFVDPSGAPWLVFCHEWLQAGDGAIYAQRLSDDLRTSRGSPTLLFTASQAPWTRPFRNAATGYDDHAYITDGPFVVHDDAGLALLWSSGGEGGYSVGVARSSTGLITGPWVHQPQPLVAADGGHAMLLATRGDRFLIFHQPNELPFERLTIERVAEASGIYRIPADREIL
ncbi:glycoside hydrolase family 43 protein [Promicromonospora sp. NPDC057138]|uniref:glycoside hydrolase family 43 protein n=1 Tax=Promicromonospora sp. NPDC057138 TaxID=3346031 RepID=UPI00363B2D18